MKRLALSARAFRIRCRSNADGFNPAMEPAVAWQSHSQQAFGHDQLLQMHGQCSQRLLGDLVCPSRPAEDADDLKSIKATSERCQVTSLVPTAVGTTGPPGSVKGAPKPLAITSFEGGEPQRLHQKEKAPHLNYHL